VSLGCIGLAGHGVGGSSIIQLSISQVEPHDSLFGSLIRLPTLAVLSQLADIPFSTWLYQ